MSFFDHFPKYYLGEKYNVILLDSCKKQLKKAGVFYRVISRVKKVCDTGNFGPVNKRHKYFVRKNIGWLKWDDGTRVYFSKFDNKIIILTVSGSKNNQDDDISEAEKIVGEINVEVKKYEEKK